MATNILNKLQQNLGYPPLKKIDPNTQEAEINRNEIDESRMGQAVVPAVLAGIYQLSKSEEGIRMIAMDTDETDWLDIIFLHHAPQVIQNVANYAYSSAEVARKRLDDAAREAIKIIREIKKPSENFSDIKIYIAGERNHILPYLPAALHIGNLTDNPTMDDRTNKMEGPVSSFMHMMETGFSGHETKEDADEKKLNY